MQRFSIGPVRAVAILFAIAMIASFATAASAEGPWPQTRQGWFIGLGVGGGSAGLTSDGESSDREAGPGGSFRAGYSFTNELGLGLETNGWTKEMDGTTFTFGVAAPTLYYYPAGKGFVLRAGIGAGSAEASIEHGNSTRSTSETGFGFTIGAQYDFRVMRTFSIGPQVDFGWMTLDDFDVNYVNGGISINWYFIPK